MTLTVIDSLKNTIIEINVHDHDKLLIAETGDVRLNSDTARNDGIAVKADDSGFIQNDGHIAGAIGVSLTDHARLQIGETGRVEAEAWGVALSGESPTVVNAGTIIATNDFPAQASGFTVAAIHSMNALSTKIVNTGTIKAGGNVEFAIFSSSSKDTVLNNGKIVGDVSLGGGNDSFDTSKGKVAGSIDAGTGNDKITGSAFADTLTGGTGSDTFVFKTKADSHAVDHITDFKHGQDKIVLSKALFKLDHGETKAEAFHDITAGMKLEQADDHILYNHKTGWLSYDADGAGGKAPVHFATLDHHPILTAGDILMV